VAELVFPGNRNGRGGTRGQISPTTLLQLIRDLGYDAATTHGFRSSFADWCSERTNFPSELREMALAHSVGNKVQEAYRRGDLFEKRRALMDAWERHCAAPAVAGEIVPLHSIGAAL
jgi:integrase